MEVGDWDPPTPKRMALVKNFVGNKLMETKGTDSVTRVSEVAPYHGDYL